MRSLLLLLALCPSLLAAKPNILLIYSDDHGWADLGAQGVNGDIRTPNLDQLAKDGVRFSRGYVTAPQCVPSRAGVLTGRYQQRFGVEDNGKGPLPLAELTIAERLKPAGYLTGQVGKWHLDLGAKGTAKGERMLRAMPEYMPHGQGFDEYWRGELRQFYASHDLQGKPFADAPHLVTDDRFRVLVQTDAALSFLDRRSAKTEQPWFLYLAWYAPHVPLDSPEPWFSQTPAHLPKERRQALSMIACMDDGLGKIRTKLREMGQEKNTLIFFISDNGAPLGGAWNGSLNLPLIGQKGMLSEGGIRTPFVAAWPGTLPAGATYDQPVISLDVAATAVALAGLPHDDKLDGVNLMPFVSGENKAAPHDTLYWRWGSQAAVLEMPYKLIFLGEREKLLFDVTKPEGENIARNLIAKHPDIATRLETKLKAWSATLQPPGLPTTFDAHHEGLFGEHDLIPKAAAEAKPAPAGSIQGWLCRNGSIALKNGALAITPQADAKPPFIANAAIDAAGPLTVTLDCRAKQGGAAAMTWREKGQSDFEKNQRAAFEWPTGDEWREVSFVLGNHGNVIHLRLLTPDGGKGLEVRSISLKGGARHPTTWRFDQTAK